MPLDPLDIRYFKMAVGDVKSESANDVVARCPICGDSQHSNKARLHLYCKKDITLVNCFNGGCPCSNRTVYTFLRDFYPQLFNNYKRDKFKTALKGGIEDTFVDFMSGMQPSMPQETEAKTESLTQFLQPLSDECKQYLEKRQLRNYSKYVFTAKSNAFLNGKRLPIQGFLIVPLIKGNEMYGFYTRSASKKVFYTYIKEHYVGYKAWNLFSVDLEQPVYIFEGIFDALSAMQCGLSNSIALMGAKPSQEMLRMIKHPVFCLDNDRTGILNSLEYSKHYPVVVYPFDEPKDANEMLLAGIDLFDTITKNQLTGIRATVALKAKL